MKQVFQLRHHKIDIGYRKTDASGFAVGEELSGQVRIPLDTPIPSPHSKPTITATPPTFVAKTSPTGVRFKLESYHEHQNVKLSKGAEYLRSIVLEAKKSDTKKGKELIALVENLTVTEGEELLRIIDDSYFTLREHMIEKIWTREKIISAIFF